MEEKRKEAIESLRNASPLEAAKMLQEMELYDRKISQEVIDEVYEQFQSGENMKDEVLKPVFMAVIDGLMEALPGSAAEAARKKGLTASRVLQECESFRYDAELDNSAKVNAYTEYKNLRDLQKPNSNTSEKYVRENYEDKNKMESYKESKVHGEKTITDEYTGKDNLYAKRDNPNQHYNDENYRKQAQPDHIVPLKELHKNLSNNYALDDSDIKRIANIDENLAVTSAEINQQKQDKTNEEYIKYKEKNGEPLDETTKKNMLELQKSAEKATNKEANKTVLNNLTGQGQADSKAVKAAVEKFKEENGGKTPTKEQRAEIERNLSKEKTRQIQGTMVKNAAEQSKDYAIGNLVLFIVKPLYYEISDIFKNGLKEGVGAGSGGEALKIRFGRIKTYVVTHAKEFIGDNIWEFIKGFISSLIEGIISLFVGIFKQVLKILKEGIKIFVQSAKVLFGENSKDMSPAQKGDAIIKIIGGSVIAIAGVALDALLNKIGIGKLAIVISTLLSGIASALFMYLLDKADIFSVKAEKRRDRIIEIFDERINDVNEAADSLNTAAIETLTHQREQFEEINDKINEGITSDNIISINDGLYKMAKFMNIDLGYSNDQEFCNYMEAHPVIQL